MTAKAPGTWPSVHGSRWSRRAMLGASAAGVATALAGPRRRARAQDHSHVGTPTAGTPTATPAGLQVRQNGASFSPTERMNFVNAVKGIKQKPSPWAPGLSVYDTFVLWHRDAFGCAVMAAHMGPAFLPWHRQFLLMFERELQALDPTVTVPYWDWTVDQGHDAYLWDDDFLGGNGDPAANYAVTTGPFRRDAWELTVFDYGDDVRSPYLVREFGASALAPVLPSRDELEVALNNPVYDAAPWTTIIPEGGSFRNALEGWHDCVAETCDPVNGMAPTCTGDHGLHNRVHLWIAGEIAFAAEGGREEAEAAEAAAATLAVPGTPAPATNLFGTMAANTSLNDPVFWLHHANIDRIWSEWLRRHGPVYLPESGGPLGHNIDDDMWPYNHLGRSITPRMMLDSTVLGYVYDTEV